MDYYNKYLKYKTKYVNFKYNNQYGGAGEYVCVLDPEGDFDSYAACNGIDIVSQLSDSASKLLFIGLPIAQASNLGKEIEDHISKATGNTPFKDYAKDGTNLDSPHISLISIYIPKDSELDKLLSDKAKFKVIMDYIKELFNHYFDVDHVNYRSELHSKEKKYKGFNEWIVRVYDEEKHLYYVSEHFDYFKHAMIEYLLDNINSKDHEQYKKAITTPWKPYLFLTKNIQYLKKFIDIITLRNSKSKSFINLWRVNKTKSIRLNTGQGHYLKQHGSLEYIYGAYDKNKLYIKI